MRPRSSSERALMSRSSSDWAAWVCSPHWDKESTSLSWRRPSSSERLQPASSRWRSSTAKSSSEVASLGTWSLRLSSSTLTTSAFTCIVFRYALMGLRLCCRSCVTWFPCASICSSVCLQTSSMCCSTSAACSSMRPAISCECCSATSICFVSSSARRATASSTSCRLTCCACSSRTSAWVSPRLAPMELITWAFSLMCSRHVRRRSRVASAAAKRSFSCPSISAYL
mmetsp:Transcript_5336/g.10873  ORF Transcript_5336/g.10873 Transcript_5336/m.10873 type:complete len:227 (-) Transcript_5336:530-1210(-)